MGTFLFYSTHTHTHIHTHTHTHTHTHKQTYFVLKHIKSKREMLIEVLIDILIQDVKEIPFTF